MRIRHSVILAAHPRANGLVEQYNGVIHHGLCKQLVAMPGIHPQEALPEVLAGVRLLPTRLSLSPFLLLYKQAPRWSLGEAKIAGNDDTDLPEDCPDNIL